MKGTIKDPATLKKSGGRISQARIRIGLNQRQLADAAVYTVPYICSIEKGKKPLTVEAGKRLADILHCRYEYLMCIDDYETSERLAEAEKHISRTLYAIDVPMFYNGAWVIYTDKDPDTIYILDRKTSVVSSFPREVLDQFAEEIMDYIAWKYDRLKKQGNIVPAEQKEDILRHSSDFSKSADRDLSWDKLIFSIKTRHGLK